MLQIGPRFVDVQLQISQTILSLYAVDSHGFDALVEIAELIHVTV